MNTKTIGYILVGLVLLIEIPRFYGTYADLDPMLFNLPLTAIGTGIVLPVGAGYVFHAWWSTARKRRDWLLIAFTLLLVLEGVILVPWGMARLQAESLATVVGSGWLAWGWVSVVMLSPFVLVGAVVMAMAFQKESTRKHDANPVQRDATPVQSPQFTTKQEHVIWLHERHPDLQHAQLADLADCSVSTVSRALNLTNFGNDGRL